MRHSLFLLNLLPVALAQYNYGGGDSTPSSTQTPSSAASGSASAVQTITVGNGGFKFSPDTLTVKPGDKVVFQFYPGAHGVTAGPFNNPCQPSNGTFFSGFINSNSGPASDVFTLQVNSTDPIWLYCPQVGHCQAGMVGVINPPTSGNTLDGYRSAASKSSSSAAPPNAQGGVVGAPPSNNGQSSSGGSNSGGGQPGDGGNSLSSLANGGALLSVISSLFALIL